MDEREAAFVSKLEVVAATLNAKVKEGGTDAAKYRKALLEIQSALNLAHHIL